MNACTDLEGTPGMLVHTHTHLERVHVGTHLEGAPRAQNVHASRCSHKHTSRGHRRASRGR